MSTWRITRRECSKDMEHLQLEMQYVGIFLYHQICRFITCTMRYKNFMAGKIHIYAVFFYRKNRTASVIVHAILQRWFPSGQLFAWNNRCECQINQSIRKCMWSTPGTIKSTAASIKKFYSSMLQRCNIDESNYRELIETIRDNMDCWLKDCESYNNPDAPNPFAFFWYSQNNDLFCIWTGWCSGKKKKRSCKEVNFRESGGETLKCLHFCHHAEF